jgi:2-iminobutanoate/2-iminopropanoate deaminase
MKKIKPDNFHEPAGHYSPAVISNGFVFVSGQVAVDPETGEPVGGRIEDQTEICIRNLEKVLQAAGSGLNNVVKMTLFVSDEKYWPAVNETYKKIFGDHKPARAIIPVGSFREPFLIEIEAVAEAPAEG